ncbi:MAG: AMP-binding protein, partial [Sphaerospermopsis sp. SIO1G2]|nr:AMP-binding protein [Sphaerospermopsis sp. SIO1G2]
GGDGVTHGYLQRPELTAARFIPNPFGTGKLYNTGDLARYQDNGELICLGRSDHQVKVRGFRIELGEIETTLAQHHAVTDCVALVREDTPDDQRLVAYYRAAESLNPGMLYDFLHDRLPYYMIPSNFVWLAAFPLTPNGKINRLALPAPSQLEKPEQLNFVEATTALEKDLTDLWESVLKVKPIGIHDNFFHLGGHSLTALRLFSKIDKLTGRKLPLATLFEAPTIAELAERINDRTLEPKWSTIVPIKPSGYERPFFYVSPYDISVLEMRSIAEHFDPNRPFYGIQPYGLSEGEEPHTTIPEMAAHYIQAIKDLVPEGPYLIGGHCAGGWVAYEIAYQLEKAGDQIAYLGIVDIPAPTYQPKEQNRLSYLINRASHYMSDRRLFNALAWQIKMQAERARLYRIKSPTVQRIQAVRLAHDEAFDHYRPSTDYAYSGNFSVICSSDNMTIYNDDAWYLEWNNLTSQSVDFQHINSTHANLITEPFVQELARVLVTGIAQADKVHES